MNETINDNNQIIDNQINNTINSTNTDQSENINNTNSENNNSKFDTPISNNNSRIKNINLIKNIISPNNLEREYNHEPITNITIETNHLDPTLKLKIAFISDSHIDPDNPKKRPFEKNLYNSFLNLKSQNIDIIIFGGDLCDVCSENAFKKFFFFF